jgi:hypothetical protein
MNKHAPHTAPARWIAGVLVALNFMVAHHAEAITIVEDGVARASIVVADGASPAARRASAILQSHLKQITGADVPVVAEGKLDAAKQQALIFIGDGKLAKARGMSSEGLGAGGFHAEAKGDTLALLGTDTRTASDVWGSVYATAWLLETKLGVHYLWPGELGKVVPKQRTVTVADFQHRTTPALAQRQIRSMGYHDRLQVGLDHLGFTKADYERLRAASMATTAETCDWFQWQGMGGTLNILGGHAFGHLWAKYGKEHPDWFALQPNGSRDQSFSADRSRLCKSNPDLIAAIAKEKIEELNGKPNVLGLSLGPNDGGRATFCTCPKCEALDAPNGRKITLWDMTGKGRRDFEHVSLTDRMVFFWNSIAEQVTKVHPNALFTVDAYSSYTAAPVQRKLHPNLVVRFAGISYEDEASRQQGVGDWDAWAQMAKRIYFRSNCMLAGRRTGMPLIYAHRFAEDFRHLASRAMMGTDLDSCTHNWATQGLNYYVAARLHWDASRDVDAMIDDYCRAGFGAAAKTMRAYFARLEAAYAGTASRHEPAFSGFTDALLAELNTLIARAAEETAADAESAKRVEFVRTGTRWTELEVKAHRFLEAGDAADKAAAKVILDQRFAMMREIFQKQPLAVNVGYVSWGEDGGWSKLGWKAPK